MPYTPLTEEQYNKALSSGFTHDQIIEHEKTRRAQEEPQLNELSAAKARYAEGSSPSGIIKNLVNNIVPATGGIVGSVLAGPAGGVGGAMVGAGIKEGAKSIAPSFFGEPEGVGGMVSDTALQGVLPEAVGGLGGILKSLKTSGLRQTLADLIPSSLGAKLPGTHAAEIINKAKGMLRPESGMVETAGANTRLNPNVEIPSGTVADELAQTPYTHNQLMNIPPIGKTADKIFSDISEVRNAKIGSGDPTIIRQLAQDRILRKNWNFENGSFDPAKVLNDLGKNEDIYKEAIGPSFNNFRDLMKTAQELKVGQHPDSLFSFKERGKLYIGAGLVSAFFGKEAFAATEGIILSADVMKRAFNDPALGQLIIAGMKTPRTSPAAGLLSKVIANSLRGATVYLQGEDGQKEKAIVGPGGTLQTEAPLK